MEITVKKLSLYILAVTLIITIGGCIQKDTTSISNETPVTKNNPVPSQKIAEIMDYKISGDSMGPYILVNVSFKKLPITVYLLDEYGGILDSKTVKNVRELPIRLYLGGQINIFNEWDVIQVRYNGQITDERKIFIRGPEVKILKVYSWYFRKLYFGKSGEACSFDDVRILVKNDGNAPAYVKTIKIIGNDMELISSVNTEYPIPPNETKTLSSGSAFFKRVDNQGTYAILPKGLTFDSATLQLLDPKGEILASTTVSFKVTC